MQYLSEVVWNFAITSLGILLPESKVPKSNPGTFSHYKLPITALFFLLAFHFFLMRFDDRTRDMRRHDIVVIELHGEIAASTRD